MSAEPAHARRIAGVTIPLFSLRSPRSWGIGEIADLPELAAWLREAGVRLIQILPLGEIAGGETSPYSALTAFGIDPMYIALEGLPDLGGDVEKAVGGAAGALLLERARGARTVDYGAVRALKRQALRFAFERFAADELGKKSPRAAEFTAFREQSKEWIDDYALFRALKDAHGGVAWWEWGNKLAHRDGGALGEARREHEKAIQFYAYAQWLAHTQWQGARARLKEMGVEIMGDLPFMVGRDSADVWSHQSEFRDNATVGVPGDQFNAEGQDWGLPPYNWETMRENDFAWLRRRARYTGSLYDRFRIDHLVGFYRTYTRKLDALRGEDGKLTKGTFDPAEEEAQIAHGERVIGAMIEGARETGATLVAEDLGVVPDLVRASLAKLEVPGYKVLIWEKDYKQDEKPFLDPTTYPEVSVACFGTHDTDSVVVWWEGLGEEEREAVKRIPALAAHADKLGPEFTPDVHRALFDLLNAAGSGLVLFLIQDLLGARERINTPATMGPENWALRLPAPVEDLRRDEELGRKLGMARASIDASGRGG